MTSSFVAHIELPYDRGHYWRLVVGTEKAVISERAAFVLAGRFGVPVQGEPKLVESLSGVAHFIGEDFHLSKKAARLLAAAGIEKVGGQ